MHKFINNYINFKRNCFIYINLITFIYIKIARKIGNSSHILWNIKAKNSKISNFPKEISKMELN